MNPRPIGIVDDRAALMRKMAVLEARLQSELTAEQYELVRQAILVRDALTSYIKDDETDAALAIVAQRLGIAPDVMGVAADQAWLEVGPGGRLDHRPSGPSSN